MPAPTQPLIRRRGYLLAALLAPLMAFWFIYGEIVLMTTSASYSIIPGVIALFFLIALGNAVAHRVRPASSLNAAEMALLYSVATLSATLAGFDFLQLLPVSLAFTGYYGPQQAQDTFSRLGANLPWWYGPKDAEILRMFFQGGGDWRDLALWRAWAVPLAYWTIFVSLLLSVTMALNLLIREQWLEQDRLPFPIIELPLTLSEPTKRDTLLRSRLFWLGLGITFALLSLNALSTILPSVPGIQLNLNNIAHPFPYPFSGAGPLYVSWTPFTFGIAFFVPLDILFSSWFFFVLRKALEVLGVVVGWRDAGAGNAPGQFPFVRDVAQGAWIGLAIVLLWGGRHHFSAIFRKAFPRATSGSPPHHGYRVALIAVGAGWLLLSLLFIVAGLQWWLALLYCAAFLISTLVMTRVFAQIGAPVLELYFFNTESLMLAFTGTKLLTTSDSAILGQAYWFNHAYRQHPMGQQLAALALAKETKARPTSFIPPLALTAAVGTLVALATMIATYHHFGAATAKVNGGQLGVGGWELWNRAASWESNPKTPQGLPLVIMAISAIFCLWLGRLGDLWVASPFRPIGFAFAFSYALDYIWNIFVLIWLFKLLLLRYGGLEAYRKLTPLFLGIALGDALAQTLWGLIGATLGLPGVSPYLPASW